MKKYIAIVEGRSIKLYNLSKITSPMVVIRNHLHRVDEHLFYLEKGSNRAIVFTELESTQVYSDGNTYVDPDEAIAIFDTAPDLKKKVAVWNRVMDGGGMPFVYICLGFIMVAYFLWGMLT